MNFLEALKKGSSPELAHDLYGCTGREGSWTGASWDRAEHLFQALGLLLVHPVARQVQLDFTASKILSWVMPATQKLLFQDLHATGWWGALQAAVVSFSANLPAVADKHFRAFVEEKGGIEAHRVDHDFVLGAIDAMTYRPKIAIYPHRKAAILPTIERLYGVTFCRTPENNPIVEVGMSPKQVQEILLALRYDLGPAGADGVFGPKTVAALTEYQRMRGLDPDGTLGPKTRAELAKEEVPKELPVIILQLNETHRLVQNPRGSWDLQQQAKKGWKRLTTHSNIKQAAESLVQRRPDLLLCVEGKVTMSLGTFLSNLADATLSLEETLSKAAKNQG